MQYTAQLRCARARDSLVQLDAEWTPLVVLLAAASVVLHAFMRSVPSKGEHAKKKNMTLLKDAFAASWKPRLNPNVA